MLSGGDFTDPGNLARSGMKSIRTLLVRLKERNEREDFGGTLRQRIMPPDPFGPVATLDPRISKQLTPMLRERFSFAGEWTNAATGGRWLSLPGMQMLPKQTKVRRQIRLRVENWKQSPVATFPRNRLSLFGIDESECDETYLLWSDSKEPEVVAFYSWEEKRFRDLQAYLEFLIG